MVYAESLRSFALPANLKRKAVQVFVAVVLATPALVKPPPASAVIRGSSFYTLTGIGTWTDTQSQAVNLGGNLVTINNSPENIFLVEQFYAPPTTFATWIGYYQTGSNSGYRWVSGENSTYTNWAPVAPDFPSWEFYAHIDLYPSAYAVGTWQDSDNNGYGNQGLSAGIAEIPIAFSASQSASPIEGSGLFTTSLFFSAGTGSNLVDGATIYWGLDGITADDLSSGTMTGFGVVTNGRLDIIHSLFDDGVDEIENFIVTAYSDPILRTSDYQIGTYSAPVRSATSSTASVPGPIPLLALSSAFYWTRRLRKRIKNNKATLRIASAD